MALRSMFVAKGLIELLNFIRVPRVSSGLAIRNISGLSYRFACVVGVQKQHFSTNEVGAPLTEFSKPEKKKREPVPKIMLIASKTEVSVITLEEAKKVAKHRGLVLEKVQEPSVKSTRAVYKLTTNAKRYFGDEDRATKSGEESKRQKDAKLFSIDGKITEHDLCFKIKKMNKLLAKGSRVKIVISGHGDAERAKNVCDTILTDTKEEGEVQTKSDKKAVVILSLRPIKKDTTNKGEEVVETA